MTDNKIFIPRTLEAKGKSIDEAIFNGMQELGLSIDEVSIETLQEGSKGILGIGARPYIVRLTERDQNYTLRETEDENKESIDEEDKRAESPKLEALPPNRSNSSRNYQSSARGRTRNETKTRDFGSKQQSGYVRNREPFQPISNVAQLVEYTPYIVGENECDGADFLLGMLDRMGVKAKLGVYQAEGMIKYRIDSETMGILIGHRGETLDALQYLTSLVVNRGKENYRRVTLDTENYRCKREETLVRLARKIASQVKATGKSVALEPMNPYERRVMHAALQKNPYVQTYSEGEEPDRHVVIALKRDVRS